MFSKLFYFLNIELSKTPHINISRAYLRYVVPVSFVNLNKTFLGGPCGQYCRLVITYSWSTYGYFDVRSRLVLDPLPNL